VLGPLGQGIDGEMGAVVPMGSEVVLCYGVHDGNVALEGFGFEELWEQLSHLLGLFLGVGLNGGGEDLVDAVGPPRRHELVLVGEDEFVGGGAAKYDGGFPEDGGFEEVGGVLGHAVEDELLRVTLPAGGEELEALTDDREAGGSRWEVGGGEGRAVLVEKEEEEEGDESDEEEKEGKVEMLHAFGVCVCVFEFVVWFFSSDVFVEVSHSTAVGIAFSLGCQFIATILGSVKFRGCLMLHISKHENKKLVQWKWCMIQTYLLNDNYNIIDFKNCLLRQKIIFHANVCDW